MWTANTERFSLQSKGLNSTAEELMQSIKKNVSEVSPSTIFAVASILEGVGCRYSKSRSQSSDVTSDVWGNFGRGKGEKREREKRGKGRKQEYEIGKGEEEGTERKREEGEKGEGRRGRGKG